jgi:hypothetical protein
MLRRASSVKRILQLLILAQVLLYTVRSTPLVKGQASSLQWITTYLLFHLFFEFLQLLGRGASHLSV